MLFFRYIGCVDQERKPRREHCMGDKYGFSFSWKRLLGISGFRNRIARATGVPTTRSGLERKLGRMLLNLLFRRK